MIFKKKCIYFQNDNIFVLKCVFDVFDIKFGFFLNI